jgi:hypothetical protein
LGVSSGGEYYVTLIRFTPSDHERIFHTRSGPNQRIKVSTNSRLSTVAEYIVNLAPSLRQSCTRVALYVSNGQDRMRIPLCLSVAELFFMTDQSREGEVFYAFVDPPPIETVELPVRKKPAEAQPTPQPHFPTAVPTVYHSGLTMFSNSFGAFPRAVTRAGSAWTAAPARNPRSTCETTSRSSSPARQCEGEALSAQITDVALLRSGEPEALSE